MKIKMIFPCLPADIMHMNQLLVLYHLLAFHMGTEAFSPEEFLC
jgi:hypothetical protein